MLGTLSLFLSLYIYIYILPIAITIAIASGQRYHSKEEVDVEVLFDDVDGKFYCLKCWSQWKVTNINGESDGSNTHELFDDDAGFYGKNTAGGQTSGFD